MRRHRTVLRILIFGLFVAAVAPSAARNERAEGREAVDAITASLDVEKTLLDEDVDRHRELVQLRTTSLEQLQAAYRALESALTSKDPAAATAVEEALQEVERLERARSEILDRERVVVDRVRDRMRRIALLETEVSRLEARAARRAGPLEGAWSVTLLPVSQRGTFRLDQTGAVVTGTYQLEGGWNGSLQGTFVDRKLRLVRIDSKLGRSMEFEGYLSANGSRIVGTWLSYDVSDGGAPSGQWTAVRSESNP